MHDRRVMECWIALAVIAVLVAGLLSTVVMRSQSVVPGPVRNGDSYSRVLNGVNRTTQRAVSVFFGFAAWDAGDGGLKTIVAPANLEALSPRTPDYHATNTASAFSDVFIQQASGAQLVAAAYDTTLTPGEIAQLRATLKERTYPRDMVAFIAKKPEPKVVAFTDASHQAIYLVPFSASRLGGGGE